MMTLEMTRSNFLYSIKKVLLECEDVWFCYMNNNPYFKIYVNFEKLKTFSKGEIPLHPHKQYEGRYPITFKIVNRKHYIHFFKPCIKSGKKNEVCYKVSEMNDLLKLCFQIYKTLESKRLFSDLDEVVTKRNLRLLDN